MTNEQQKSVFKMIAMLKRAGNELQLPHSRSLGKKLFELRERSYGYRIYYMFYKECLIVVGNKETQKQDIVKARSRLTKVLQA